MDLTDAVQEIEAAAGGRLLCVGPISRSVRFTCPGPGWQAPPPAPLALVLLAAHQPDRCARMHGFDGEGTLQAGQGAAGGVWLSEAPVFADRALALLPSGPGFSAVEVRISPGRPAAALERLGQLTCEQAHAAAAAHAQDGRVNACALLGGRGLGASTRRIGRPEASVIRFRADSLPGPEQASGAASLGLEACRKALQAAGPGLLAEHCSPRRGARFREDGAGMWAAAAALAAGGVLHAAAEAVPARASAVAARHPDGASVTGYRPSSPYRPGRPAGTPGEGSGPALGEGPL